MKFRALEPQEIECRIGQIAKNGSGLSLLLFKTARVDADILDETVGPEWTYKDDAGSPSNMEAAKGEASDALTKIAA